MKHFSWIRSLTYFSMIYIVAFITWWAILLVKTKRENFSYQKEIIELKSAYSNKSIVSLEEDAQKAQTMVIYEGLVFLTILSISFLFVRQLLKKEEKFDFLKRNFILATTHEFKTPVASLKLNLQTLQSKKIPEEAKSILLANSEKEVNRLNHLVNNLLIASKIDSKQYEFSTTRLEYAHWIHKLISSQFHYAEARLTLNLQKNILIDADEASLQVILMNLVENALKYSPQESPVEIELIKDEREAVLKIKDLGNGIPDKYKDKIWERFYRVEDERTRSNTGTGLGLFLVKNMVSINKGKILVYDNVPQGCIFEFIMPIRFE